MTESWRFLVDENLLGLLRWLRILGFDAIAFQAVPDSVLIHEAQVQGRILLTQDRQLVADFPQAILVAADEPKAQALEVAKRLKLQITAPLTRCLKCNAELKEVSKAHVNVQVAPKTLEIYDQFFECPVCRQIFWKGSHFKKLMKEVEAINQALSG
ncbi:Mut7-C RNAse domain-containing protein [Bdellovibrio sp. NC01]|uniref:Mut7-C RNAse domain-containing protein n=1 Tax=Bdellovibrio sp. NC01 TaxID=2220073 RepID=UPI001157F7A7|nr:Mut7-C RNAse domain-containing protein [Bdellovibrio sp. NC01]QDK36898.1 hypothetical protein DOE51_04480 [Bdellovibrio sp. NC01]